MEQTKSLTKLFSFDLVTIFRRLFALREFPRWYISIMRVIAIVTKVLDSFGLDPESPIRARTNHWWSRRKGDKLLFSAYNNKSYSQFGEDSVLQYLLTGETGTYIDIGSGHPVSGSNTYLLYEQGWQGIVVDPIRSNIEESKRLRPRDTCVQAACGETSGGMVTFYEFDVYEYSTTSWARVLELKQMGHLLKDVYSVPASTLNDLLPTTPIGPISVLCIDVEGGELSVLMGNNWDRFQPQFIIVEEWNPPLMKETDISRFLSERGYTLCAVAGVSSFYRRDSDPTGLLEATP